MAWRWDPVAVLMLGCAAGMVALAAYAVRARRGPAAPLLAMLLAIAEWAATYACELAAPTLALKDVFGAAKYAGISLLGPAWLVFTLVWLGRRRKPPRGVLVALLVEPLVVLALLALPGARRLVRYYPPGSDAETHPIVASGPLFWPHLVYTDLLMLATMVVFVGVLLRVSRHYRRQAVVVVASAVLPWLVNLGYNLHVPGLDRVDLTPVAFSLTAAVIVWGVVGQRLQDVVPVARGVVLERMREGMVVLDFSGRVMDLNAAAVELLGVGKRAAVGRALADLAPEVAVAGRDALHGDPEVTLGGRRFDVTSTPLDDGRGHQSGRLLMLRDVTDQRRAEETLHAVLAERTRLLAERTRVAAALQESLLPRELPEVPGLEIAARYRPAGDGTEIGGDFYDVFALDGGRWAVVLGDVSGKGAAAAAVTGLVRNALRVLARGCPSPAALLARLHDEVLRQCDEETFCTVVAAYVEPGPATTVVTLALGGHAQPLLARPGADPEPVGRPGSLLGLLPGAELVDTQLRLAPGDLLCLFTDGVTDARRGPAFLGEDELAAVVARRAPDGPEAVADAVEDVVRRFQDDDLRDDATVLVVRVPPAARVDDEAAPATLHAEAAPAATSPAALPAAHAEAAPPEATGQPIGSTTGASTWKVSG